MAKMRWSEEQLQAINEEGKNIIVSAGAGSGKTAVLSERVLRKLKEGIHINELLVLTFTNAAAQEMKERIRKKIKETKGLEQEQDLIDASYITTFDSFSLSIVKKYHTKLNITNNIEITDEVIIDIEKHKILDCIFEKYYASSNKKFEKLISDFCLKDDKELKNYILNIYKKIELKYDKTSYIEGYIDNYFKDENINDQVKSYVSLIFDDIKNIKRLLIELNDYFDGDYLTKLEDTLNKLLDATTYEEVLASLNFKQLPIVPRNSVEEGKKIKAVISDLVKEIKSYCLYQTTTEMKEEIYNTKDNIEIIMEIVKELDNRLDLYKQEKQIYNFNDIARLAIKVIKENVEIKEELKQNFNEILVDEYQDTSDTQEAFINLISKNNIYMVGDIKQSIYRFRNANPYIFKNKYDLYRDSDAGVKIDLLKNFRSRREVLANINLLFDLFMDDEIGNADYKASHRMQFGNSSYEEQGSTNQDYNFELLTYDLDKGKNITKDETEAFIIGNDIKNKIENNYQIFDKDEGVLRNINYNDCVILLDRSKNFDLYKKIFEYLGIPLTILKEESIKKDQDVLVIKNLLKLLKCIKEKDYSDTFKYSFTSIARSFLFRYSDSEIFDFFINNSFYNTELYLKAVSLTKEIDLMNPAEYLNYILDAFEYDKKLLTIGNIKSFQVRAEYFYNLIKNFSASGKTIYDFIEYLDEIFESDYDLKFNVNTNNSNSCKIMTIHKSKGLEFPICYFAGLTDKFNTQELKEKIIFDNKLGIIIPKVDKYYKDTILKTILKYNTKKEEISERIRLLYVAVTRAKEKMIFVTPKIEEEISLVNDIVPNYERIKYSKFFDIFKSIYANIEEYSKECASTATKKYQISTNDKIDIDKNKVIDELNIEQINIENKEIEEAHFSKDSFHLCTKEEKDLLNFGTKVHEVLETIDFKNPNYEIYNLSSSMQEKIMYFINTDLIQSNLFANFYKEYEFTFLKDNILSHGIIDLLIENKDKIIIIDYKLKNIDDVNYDLQLNGYKEFIKTKTTKEVECYLYSILDKSFRKVL